MARYSLKNKVYTQICRSRRNVFLRSDFTSLSKDYDQVGRALQQLVQDQTLIKIGYGLYAKAKLNRYTGKPRIAANGGFNQVAKEALKRLDVPFEDLSAAISQEQSITQVPANTVVQVKKRFNRSIGIPNKFKLRVKK